MSTRLNIHALVVLLSLLAWPDPALAWRGDAIAVFSGDTLTVLYNVRHVQIQLHGLNAPDRTQPLGKEALRFTSRLVKRKRVQGPYGLDGNRRVLARIRFGKKCLNEELLRAGLARWVRTGTPHDKRLQRMEAEAKKARRGLWGAGK